MPNDNKYIHKTPGVKLRRIRKPGDLETLKRKLWAAVVASEDLLFNKDATHADQLRAVHALVQAAGAYHKLLETADVERRLEALEESLKRQRVGGRAYA